MKLKVFLLIAQGFYAENRWQMRREYFRIPPKMGKDSSMQHILVHDNLVVFWIFIQFQLRQSNHVVVYQGFNKYHLIVRGLFKNFKTPNIINKLLALHVYYVGGF